jgi:hypothetical protein
MLLVESEVAVITYVTTLPGETASGEESTSRLTSGPVFPARPTEVAPP